MRAVVQRVACARVTVSGRELSAIGRGLLVLLGVAHRDNAVAAEWLFDKIVNMRIFADANGKFDHSLRDLGAELMVVSQFTLYADTRKGRRPSFADAAPPAEAERLYNHFIRHARQQGMRVAAGEFGAHMQVEFVNDGPVTIIVDSPAT